jgi:TetR/AcrR family transcriptional regulator, repressor for uid operon
MVHAKAELRRRQILTAAATCFRQYGFHGASIAKISAAAGMSSGHIYHFFTNKEAIIGAIVEDRVEHFLGIIADLESEADLFEAFIARADVGVNEKTEVNFAALWLEILAEAARNPEIAQIVRAADEKMRQRLVELESRARQTRGIESTLAKGAGTEVIMAMFEGLANRIVQNPNLDKTALVKALRVALQAILTH